MKLKLLDTKQFIHGLIPVTSTELKTRAGNFDPNGLFSEKIFGIEDSLDRSRRYSYIKLNTKIIHPSLYRLLIRINRKLEKFFSTEETFSLNSKNELVVTKDGINGIPEFIKIFDKLELKGETEEREKIIKLLKDANKDGKLFIDIIPVIPPAFRPMYEDEHKNLVVDELNNIYINILRKASQVKNVGSGSDLSNLLTFYLQRSINDYDQFIRTKISKKRGLIRSNMLGKRIDFSGRAVITPGPNLKINEIGVPLLMAATLFQPFLIHYLLFSKEYPYRNELDEEIKKFTDDDLSVDTVNRIIKSIRVGDKIPDKLFQLFFDATEIVMKGRVVLAKRDPALHDGSYRAFYPKLVTGNTIQMCTLQVGGFNADFDGDQMAIFHPLTKQAQEEAKTKMMSGKGSKSNHHVTFELSKEMVAGLYTMTKNKSKNNSPLAVTPTILSESTDPYVRVKYRGHTTTMGRAIFNSAFPPDFKFMDVLVTKKYVNNLIPIIIDKYGEEIAVEIFSKLEKIGFKFSTIMAPTLTLDMIELPDSILRIKDKLKDSSPEEAEKLLKDAEKIMINHLKDTGLYDLVESGAGKGWMQPRQILVAKGVIADPKGNVLPPIKGSFSEGLQSSEYFEAASGARKGMADRALNTAETGYFTRQLVYVLGPAEASPTLKDCKTKRTVNLRLTNDLIKRLYGRFIIYGGKLVEFHPSKFKVGDTIHLRSPIFCESRKFCHTCYGKLLLRHKTPYVGILAGASIGERSTQLIMRTFHTGGATSFTVHPMIEDIYDNDPLISIDLKKYFFQSEDKLVVLKPCKITIDLTMYTMGDDIQINDDAVWVNHLISKIEFEDTIFNLMLDYPLNVKKINMEIFPKEKIEFSFIKNDIIIEVPASTVEIKEQVNYTKRLLGGKVVYKDPSHLLSKVMKIYGPISNLDLVHFEVLVSQILRDKNNQLLPARLGKTWDPVMMNIKKTVFASGFVQGLAFENINKAIETGLISSGEIENSLLGKLVVGEDITKRK